MAEVQKQMAFDPNVFVARWYCGEVLPEDMPGFAANPLEEGFDGDALRRLAGLVKPTSRDVGDLFVRALEEIGTVVVHDKQQAISTLAKVLARAIVEGKLDPFAGAQRLSRYAMEAGYPEELVLFFQLADEPLWGGYARSHDLIRADIIAESKKLIAR